MHYIFSKHLSRAKHCVRQWADNDKITWPVPSRELDSNRQRAVEQVV